MATKRNTTPQSKKPISKKPKAAKTSKATKVVKKAVVKKSVAKVKTKPKKVTRARKRVLSSATKPKTTLMKKWSSLWGLFIVLLGVVVIGVLAINPALLNSIQGNLLTQLEVKDSSRVLTSIPNSSGGILLTYQNGGENEEKLADIFRTVFPDISLEEVHFQSARGKELVSQLSTTELPNIYFEKSAFESQTLSEVVRDLFELHGDHYGLNVSLVNPSYQIYIAGPPSSEGGVMIGNDNAPIVAYVYSDPRCQHCRVNERNNQREFDKLVEEGLLKMIFLDLPQDTEGNFHATALNCLYQEQQDAVSYLDLRDKIYKRANLTKAFTKRELRRLGVNYDQSCDEKVFRQIFRERKRIADAEGITGIPALYLGQNGGQEFLRITGSHDYSVYQTVFDQLLGQDSSSSTSSEEANEEVAG